MSKKSGHDIGEMKKEMALYTQIIVFFVVLHVFMLCWSYYDWVTIPNGNTQMSPAYKEAGWHIGNSVDAGLHESSSYQLQHGDVVYYTYPNDYLLEPDASLFFSRVIGLPGDTIGIKDGKVIRNGEEIAESYTLKNSEEYLPEIIVPKNYVYILNDSRDSNRYLFHNDSRCFGPISMYAISGVLSK